MKNIKIAKLVWSMGLLMLLGSVQSCNRPVCSEIECQNGGVCRDGFCQCKYGWEGPECTVKPNTKFSGKYIGVMKPGAGLAYMDSLLLVEDTTTVDTLVLGMTFKNTGIYAEAQVINENEFYFDKTLVSTFPPTWVEGSAKLEGKRLTLFFQFFQQDSTTINCSFFGDKVNWGG